MSKKKKIILTVVCIVLLVIIVGAVILYKMSITPEILGPGDFPVPDTSIRIVCENVMMSHT